MGHTKSEINEDKPLLCHTTKNIDGEGGQYICILKMGTHQLMYEILLLQQG
jgi:hypothetical protein